MDEKRLQRGRELLAEVRANLERLRQCEGPHEFEPETLTITPLMREFTCKKCGGIMHRGAIGWYLDGVKHGLAKAARERQS